MPPQSWRRGIRQPLRAALQALRRISRRRDDIEARHLWRRRTPAWGGGRRGVRTGWRVHALASVASSLERRLGLGVWVVGQVDGACARGTCGLYGLLRTHTQARRGRTGGPRPEAHHRSICWERASTRRRAGSQGLHGRPSAFGTGPWRKLEVPKVLWGRNGQRRWSGAAAHSSHGDRERSGHGRGCCGPPRRKQIVRLEAARSCNLGRSRAAAWLRCGRRCSCRSHEEQAGTQQQRVLPIQVTGARRLQGAQPRAFWLATAAALNHRDGVQAAAVCMSALRCEAGPREIYCPECAHLLRAFTVILASITAGSDNARACKQQDLTAEASSALAEHGL